MHVVNDFIFDPDKLIFYKPFVKKEVLDQIPTNDQYFELKRCLDEFNENAMTAKGKPIDQIGVCLTYNCNLNCNYCSYSSTNGHSDCLSVDDIISFVIEAIKSKKMYDIVHGKNTDPLKFFFTGGGEPTYNWKLFSSVVTEIKRVCKKYNITPHLELTTNGMLNAEKQDFIVSNFDKIMVSYDGTADLQNKNRKCPTLKSSSYIVETSLKRFIKCGMPVTIRSTILHEDLTMLREMYDYMVKEFWGVTEWSIMPILPVGRALDLINKLDYDISDENTFFEYYLDLNKYVSEQKKKIYISSPLFINSITDYCCGATFNECFWIMPDKTINNCIEAEVEALRTNVGCIENGNVILYDKYYDSQLNEVKNNFTKCRECIAYRFCKGGCPLKSIRDRKNNTSYKAYECSILKKYWNYVFREILCGKECFGWKIEPIYIDGLEKNNIYKLSDIN